MDPEATGNREFVGASPGHECDGGEQQPDRSHRRKYLLKSNPFSFTAVQISAEPAIGVLI
jgi:hypothetical protein